jgi:hypothetical protein
MHVWCTSCLSSVFDEKLLDNDLLIQGDDSKSQPSLVAPISSAVQFQGLLICTEAFVLELQLVEKMHKWEELLS